MNNAVVNQYLADKAIATGHETVEQELARLRAENARLKTNKGSSIKVSAKGAVSLYGFGKWPVTLYKSQREKLFEKVPEIQAFIQANDAKLAVKPVTEA